MGFWKPGTLKIVPMASSEGKTSQDLPVVSEESWLVMLFTSHEDIPCHKSQYVTNMCGSTIVS